MSDVAAAAERVAAESGGDEHADHGAAESGEDEIVDVDELEEDRSIAARLRAPLEGSIREDHVGELWNVDQGGANRLVLVAEETIGLGDGLPRIFHAAIGAAEMYVANSDHLDVLAQSDSDESSSDPDHEKGEDHAEIVGYEP